MNSLTIATNTLWLIFAVTVIIFGVLSVVFWYHWQKYEVNSRRAVLFSSSYFVVTGLLLLVMLLSILAL